MPFLNGFWGPIGPFLPPRNAYILLRNTVYFHGHGITQALTVILIYAVVAAVIVGLLDHWPTRTPQVPVSTETETETAAMAVPIGAAP